MEIEEQSINDEAELLLDKIEEEMAAEDSEEDEDNLLHIDDLQNITNINKVILTLNFLRPNKCKLLLLYFYLICS